MCCVPNSCTVFMWVDELISLVHNHESCSTTVISWSRLAVIGSISSFWGGPCPFFSWLQTISHDHWDFAHTHTHWLILQILSSRRWRDGIVIEGMHVIHGRGVHTGVSGKGIDRLLSGEQVFMSVCASTIYVNSTFFIAHGTCKTFQCALYCLQHYTHAHTPSLFLYTCLFVASFSSYYGWSVTRKHGLNHRTMLFLGLPLLRATKQQQHYYNNPYHNKQPSTAISLTMQPGARPKCVITASLDIILHILLIGCSIIHMVITTILILLIRSTFSHRHHMMLLRIAFTRGKPYCVGKRCEKRHDSWMRLGVALLFPVFFVLCSKIVAVCSLCNSARSFSFPWDAFPIKRILHKHINDCVHVIHPIYPILARCNHMGGGYMCCWIVNCTCSSSLLL